MPDFLSFGDYMALTGEQEQQLLERAMADAQATRAQAQRGLSRAAAEARDAQRIESRGEGVATTTLSSASSYSDYLRLKVRAEEQCKAALNGGGTTASTIRAARAKASGVADAWTQQGDALEARQQQLADESTAGAAGYNRLADERRHRERQTAEAARLRAEQDATNRENFNANLDARMKAAWQERDRQQGTFGFDPSTQFTIYGENFRAAGDPNDNERLAQMARASGMGTQADRFQSGATFEWGKRTKGGY